MFELGIDQIQCVLWRRLQTGIILRSISRRGLIYMLWVVRFYDCATATSSILFFPTIKSRSRTPFFTAPLHLPFFCFLFSLSSFFALLIRFHLRSLAGIYFWFKYPIYSISLTISPFSTDETLFLHPCRDQHFNHLVTLILTMNLNWGRSSLPLIPDYSHESWCNTTDQVFFKIYRFGYISFDGQYLYKTFEV